MFHSCSYACVCVSANTPIAFPYSAPPCSCHVPNVCLSCSYRIIIRFRFVVLSFPIYVHNMCLELFLYTLVSFLSTLQTLISRMCLIVFPSCPYRCPIIARSTPYIYIYIYIRLSFSDHLPMYPPIMSLSSSAEQTIQIGY